MWALTGKVMSFKITFLNSAFSNNRWMQRNIRMEQMNAVNQHLLPFLFHFISQFMENTFILFSFYSCVPVFKSTYKIHLRFQQVVVISLNVLPLF